MDLGFSPLNAMRASPPPVFVPTPLSCSAASVSFTTTHFRALNLVMVPSASHNCKSSLSQDLIALLIFGLCLDPITPRPSPHPMVSLK